MIAKQMQNQNQRFANISLKTAFIIWYWGLSSLSTIKIFNPFLEITLEITIYSYPWDKTCICRNKPTSESDWSWLLLIVIANATAFCSCLLFILNGNFFIWRCYWESKKKHSLTNLFPCNYFCLYHEVVLFCNMESSSVH